MLNNVEIYTFFKIIVMVWPRHTQPDVDCVLQHLTVVLDIMRHKAVTKPAILGCFLQLVRLAQHSVYLCTIL